MGWVLFKQKNFDEARLWLQRAYEMLNDPEIAAHLGEALWRSKDREAAQAIWGDAAERFPNNQTLGETMRRYKQ
jgi:predicted negative regulator of RcsB-dependent stress response